MATEIIKFRLELYATYWDKKPSCDILINDKSYWSGIVDSNETKPTVIEFEHECEQGKEYNLIINRQGKTNTQCVIDENGKILKDQLLNIKSIEIDEITLSGLLYEGIYTPEYPEPWASQQAKAGVELPKDFKNVTEMGHNGTWTFSFTSPFYMWLLENLY